MIVTLKTIETNYYNNGRNFKIFQFNKLNQAVQQRVGCCLKAVFNHFSNACCQIFSYLIFFFCPSIDKVEKCLLAVFKTFLCNLYWQLNRNNYQQTRFFVITISETYLNCNKICNNWKFQIIPYWAKIIIITHRH